MKICYTCQQTYADDMEFCPRDGARLTAQATVTERQLAAGLSRRFRIVRRLGAGGMGTVFLAEQIGVGNRPVALKVLNRKLLDDPEFLLRFQNEAGSTGRIRHTNVVTIYESAQADDGTPYIAMEFLEGESLREALQRRGTLPLAEVAEILQQAARGLNAAHKLGIIHRDLKPDNIFLTRGDEGEQVVKIVDFGIAKLRESASHTLTGTVLGTPAYMSYEQASGMRSEELDARSDVYSLGVVVYEMLTGHVPFNSNTPLGYLRKHMMEEPPPFHTVAPGLSVPPQVETAVVKALAKDRAQRYDSALNFAIELANSAQMLRRADPPKHSSPTPTVPSLTLTSPVLSSVVKEASVRHPWLLAILGGATGLLVLLALFYFGARLGNRTSASTHNRALPEPNDVERWDWRNGGTTNVLRSIFGTRDGKRLWAVGEGGTILESDDGTQWLTRSSGSMANLYAIFGTPDGKRLWAVGERGAILESDDGEHWFPRTSGTPNNLNAIFGTSDGRHLWVVGGKGTILESGDGEHWNALPSGTKNDLSSIFATGDGKRMWTVGAGGVILESDDSRHWVTLVSAGPNRLCSIFGAIDGKRLWTVGFNGAVLSSDDGEHWITQGSGSPQNLWSIFGTSDGKRVWTVGTGGAILKSDDGKHWNRINTRTSNNLFSIFGSSDGERLWAVGENGTILESDDGKH